MGNDGHPPVDNKSGKKQKEIHEKSAPEIPGQEEVWVVTREETSHSWGHTNTEYQIEGVYTSQEQAIQAVVRHCKGPNADGWMRELWEIRHELVEFVDNSKGKVDRNGVILSLGGGDDSLYTFSVK